MKIPNTVCLLCCCIMLSCFDLRAQEIAANSFSVSGTASLEYTEGSEMSVFLKQADYSAAGQINYFIWKNISVNLGYRYGMENRLSVPLASNSYKHEYNGGFIQLRKYWFFNTYLGVYVGVEYGYRVGTIIEDHKVKLADKEYQQNINLVPGIFIFPSKKIGIEMSYGSIGYRSSILKNASGQKYGSRSDLNLSLFPDLNLGIHYFFVRK